jgi:hypothetical protein
MDRYTFYLDFLASELDDRTQNALLHLREQSDYVRVLGSYPKGSELIGPIKATLNTLSNIPITTEYPYFSVKKSDAKVPLNIGIIGTVSPLLSPLFPPPPRRGVRYIT